MQRIQQLALLPYVEARKLLRKYGLPTCGEVFFKREGELARAVSKLSFPLVLKAIAPREVHKTEAGLVKTTLHSEREVVSAFKEISGNAERQGIALDGFLLQEQKSGVELIIGGKRDAVFGETVLFGSGGLLTELFQDVAVRVAPLSRKDVRGMVFETKASAFFNEKGFRGKKVDFDVIASIILKTSRLLLKEKRVQELDFNPVIANEKKAWIVDARFMV